MITKKHILWTFLCMILLAMLTGIGAIVFPSGWIDESVLFTIFVIGIYAAGGLIIVAIAPRHGRLRWTLRVCVIALAISMLMFIATTWIVPVIGWEWSDYFGIPATISLVIGISAAHRLLIVPLQNPLLLFRLSKRVALVTAALFAMLTIIMLINSAVRSRFGNLEELLVRLLGISGIVAVGSSIATGVVVIFAPKPGEDEDGEIARSVPVGLTCPRCQSTIAAHSNKESRCPECRLKVRVQIEEPRCVCGYLLYKLESDTCPECGKDIPASERWGAGDATTASSVERSASDDPDQTPLS